MRESLASLNFYHSFYYNFLRMKNTALLLPMLLVHNKIIPHLIARGLAVYPRSWQQAGRQPQHEAVLPPRGPPSSARSTPWMGA